MLGKNVCMMSGVDDIQHMITHHLKWEFIGIDVANGYTISVIDAIKDIRMRFPDATIVVGNVVTADMTQELILAGADIIKVGVEQVLFVQHELKLELVIHNFPCYGMCRCGHGLNAHIIADGGCNNSGDIVKAFAKSGRLCNDWWNVSRS